MITIDEDEMQFAMHHRTLPVSLRTAIRRVLDDGKMVGTVENRRGQWIARKGASLDQCSLEGLPFESMDDVRRHFSGAVL